MRLLPLVTIFRDGVRYSPSLGNVLVLDDEVEGEALIAQGFAVLAPDEPAPKAAPAAAPAAPAAPVAPDAPDAPAEKPKPKPKKKGAANGG